MVKGTDSVLRSIPSVDSFLENELKPYRPRFPHRTLVKATRDVLARERKRLSGRTGAKPRTRKELVRRIAERLDSESRRSLAPLVNATGIILHTNLGRALLPKEAIERLSQAAGYFCNLEYDLDKGVRTKRAGRLSSLVCDLTGAEDAIVVNNNAGAVLLVLDTLAAGKEVIIPRGDLIEIGGSFRLPEIMAKSGARLIEIGTTNRTYIEDYERAITEDTALLMKVHWSNYTIEGFVETVSVEELVDLGRRRGLPVFEDLGSGALVDISRYGLGGEPRVKKMIGTGIDLLSFSGDKLLGGPQAGIVAGKKDLVARLKENQLARALRVGKLTIAAMEAVLEIYLRSPEVSGSIPVHAMMNNREGDLKKRAEKILRAIERAGPPGALRIGVVKTESGMGGGALPGARLPSWGLSVSGPKLNAESLARRFRLSVPPVVGRVTEDTLILDLRTVLPEQDKAIVDAVLEIGSS